jgi:hypothetical protein
MTQPTEPPIILPAAPQQRPPLAWEVVQLPMPLEPDEDPVPEMRAYFNVSWLALTVGLVLLSVFNPATADTITLITNR